MTTSFDLLFLGVEIPPADAFVLSISKIGDALTLAGATSSWEDTTPHVTGVVQVVRGGAADGVVASLDVGTLTATYLDEYAPLNSNVLAPGRTVVLCRRDVDGTPLLDARLFTGRITNITMTGSKDRQHLYTTMTAVDGVQSIATTRRQGALSPLGYETWVQRIRRLAGSANTPTNPPED